MCGSWYLEILPGLVTSNSLVVHGDSKIVKCMSNMCGSHVRKLFLAV